MPSDRCQGTNSKGKKCTKERGTKLFPDDLPGRYCLYHISQDPENVSQITCCQGTGSTGRPCSYHPRYPRGLVKEADLKYLAISKFCRLHIAEGLSRPEKETSLNTFVKHFGIDVGPKVFSIVQEYSGYNQITPILWDLETSGLDFLENEIVEIAAKNIISGETFHSLVKPDGPIDPGASEIHGYYAKDLVDAPSIIVAFQKFLCFAMKYPNPVLIAHYGKKFDVPMLNFEILRKTECFDVMLRDFRFLDSIEVFKTLLKLNVHPRKKPYCIQNLSNYFGYDREQTHQAFDDVDMLETILEKLAEKTGAALPWDEFTFRFDVKAARKMVRSQNDLKGCGAVEE